MEINFPEFSQVREMGLAKRQLLRDNALNSLVNYVTNYLIEATAHGMETVTIPLSTSGVDNLHLLTDNDFYAMTDALREKNFDEAVLTTQPTDDDRHVRSLFVSLYEKEYQEANAHEEHNLEQEVDEL